MTELNSNIANMFSQMESFISTKTVVGEPIICGNTTIIPLVDVTFGMGGGSGGGSGYDSVIKEKQKETGGGSGIGVGAKIKPSAVIVIENGTASLVNIKQQDSVNKLIDMIPGIASKLIFDKLFKKKDEKGEKEEAETEDAKGEPVAKEINE